MTKAIVKSMSRIERARIIRDRIVDVGRTHGRWERVEVGDGRQTRLWCIEDGSGWKAHIDTRFSGSSDDVQSAGYDAALLLQQSPPQTSDVLLDVYAPGAGKVMSLGTTDGADELIGMIPGPWETLFGLPKRDWTPAVTRRVARLRASKSAAS